MTLFVPQSAQIGNQPSIPNAEASAELNTAILQDPLKIQAYKNSVAKQLNDQSGGPHFEDLSDRIASMKIETSAQGASIFVVELIDPMWVIPMSGFIQVDVDGFLWPPIDVNFPSGTDCVWRLCQYSAVWQAEMTEANLTLTFEDRIVSLLREMSPIVNGGLSQGTPNQTLGGFIKMLVDNANQNLPGPNIRLVEMISPNDPNYTVQINDLPSSASSTLRANSLKLSKELTDAQQHQLLTSQQAAQQIFGGSSSSSSSLQAGLIREVEAKAKEIFKKTPSAIAGGLVASGGLEEPPK